MILAFLTRKDCGIAAEMFLAGVGIESDPKPCPLDSVFCKKWARGGIDKRYLFLELIAKDGESGLANYGLNGLNPFAPSFFLTFLLFSAKGQYETQNL